MYCPLCKAEYRDGFDRCSDCKLNLVPSLEEAQATRVVQLWKGVSVSKFNAIAGALDDANIPNHAEVGASLNQGAQSRTYAGAFVIVRLMSWIAGRNESTDCTVSVLESDRIAAKAIVDPIVSSFVDE